VPGVLSLGGANGEEVVVATSAVEVGVSVVVVLPPEPQPATPIALVADTTTATNTARAVAHFLMMTLKLSTNWSFGSAPTRGA
jgi:ureidoglycolate hydrolase